MSRTTDRKASSYEAGETPADEGFLRRWSRRKHEARRENPPAAEAESPAPAAGEGAREGPDSGEPERVLTDADMPPLESLDESSDYSLFMSPGVSEGLRQAALRKLFHAPRLNQLCELEGEYFDARGFQPLGNVVTQEMRAALERQAQKLKTRAEDAARDELTQPEPPASSPEPPPAQAAGSQPAPEAAGGPAGEESAKRRKT